MSWEESETKKKMKWNRRNTNTSFSPTRCKYSRPFPDTQQPHLNYCFYHYLKECLPQWPLQTLAWFSLSFSLCLPKALKWKTHVIIVTSKHLWQTYFWRWTFQNLPQTPYTNLYFSVSYCITLILLFTKTPTFANSVDPGQMASDQDLHCLLYSLWIWTKQKHYMM